MAATPLSAVPHNTVRVLLVMVAAALAGGAARAAEVTRVVSDRDDEARFDVHLTLGWTHAEKRGFIKRESQADQAPLIKDLQFNQTRDVLNLRADFGVFPDVGLFVEAPLVLRDDRTLEMDQSAGSSCIYPGEPNPTCVNEQNSTVLRDGILPGYQARTYGVDAQHGGVPFSRPDPRVFAGPTRSGFENLGIGVSWAVFNQVRDDTKPTWTLGFEAKLDIFQDMRFDRARPAANTAVGPGYHQLVWSTAVSKRFRGFDPYFGAWYMLPVRTNGSLYQKMPRASWSSTNPQQVAGVLFGVEQIAWEDPPASQSVTVELRGHAEEHFFGRSASELWEALAGSSLCGTDVGPVYPNCRPGLDIDPQQTASATLDPRSIYPGVTETQAYATFGGNVGLNIHVGKHVRFRGLGGLDLEMPHFITFGTQGNGGYRELIDLPGRRFKVEGTQIWSLFAEGSIMF